MSVVRWLHGGTQRGDLVQQHAGPHDLGAERLHPTVQRAGDPHERGQRGVAVRSKRLVDPDAGHAGLVGDLGDAVGPGDVVERGADEAAVARVLLGARFQIPAHLLAVVQIARRIPPLEGFGHGLFRRLARRAARSMRPGGSPGASSRKARTGRSRKRGSMSPAAPGM